MVRYEVVQVCDNDGRHVCWAKSNEHAAMIVEAVNKTPNAEFRLREALACNAGFGGNAQKGK